MRYQKKAEFSDRSFCRLAAAPLLAPVLAPGLGSADLTVDVTGPGLCRGGGQSHHPAPKNLSLQLNYNAEVGLAHYTAHMLNAGERWEY